MLRCDFAAIEEIGYHNTSYETHICSGCNGTGRIKTRSYTYVVPFDKNDSEINEIDSQIINLIRKLIIIKKMSF